jgi:hypothetical protein
MPVESSSSEVDQNQVKKWEGKLSEEERARLAIIEWRKDQKYDFKRPLVEYPQLGIGKLLYLMLCNKRCDPIIDMKSM